MGLKIIMGLTVIAAIALNAWLLMLPGNPIWTCLASGWLAGVAVAQLVDTLRYD